MRKTVFVMVLLILSTSFLCADQTWDSFIGDINLRMLAPIGDGAAMFGVSSTAIYGGLMLISVASETSLQERIKEDTNNDGFVYGNFVDNSLFTHVFTVTHVNTGQAIVAMVSNYTDYPSRATKETKLFNITTANQRNAFISELTAMRNRMQPSQQSQQPQTSQQPQQQNQPQNTGSALSYLDSGVVAYNRGEYDKAIANYTQAIRLDPNFAIAYNYRAITYNFIGDYDKAIADASQAIRINPNYKEVYNERAFAYNGKGEYDKAIADANQAIRIDPNFANPYRHRGFAYMQKGNFTQARADVNKSLQLDPNYQKARDLDAELKRRGY
ncbi:MAG: tetratricopeptide repeat protein [Treponema sp.]|jgi:Flp pilus assembly protein TadD|nr:tetratricopeptide repeat protein [Treponema sp.]